LLRQAWQRGFGCARGSDRVPPADRVPDDRGQRAGGDTPRRPPDPHAVSRARASRRAGRGAADRAARFAGGSDAARARRSPYAAAGRRRGGGGLTVGRRLGPADRPRWTGVEGPRAQVAQTGLLRPPKPRARWPPVGALLPLHVADPALPRPDLPPGAAVGDRRFAARPRRLVGGVGGPLVLEPRARGDYDRARCRRR